MAQTKSQRIDTFAKGWMEEIKAGVAYRKKFSTIDKWEAYRQYYRGNWAQGVVPINKIFSYGRLLMPRVYFRAPRVTVTATHPSLVIHAKVLEAIDNALIKEVLLKQTIKSSVLDSYLCGVGPIKLGYDSEFGYIPEQAVGDSGETATQFSRKDDNEYIEYSSVVKEGMPWALRARPDEVIVPWGSTEDTSLPWICHYILRPLDDIKKDQKYQNTDQLVGTRTPSIDALNQKGKNFRPRTNDKGIVYGELFEVRDVKTHQLMVFSEGHCLLSTPDILQTNEGLPWEFISFNPDPEFFWSIPDAHILAPQQEEINEASTQESQHRKIALIKFLYKIGAIKPDQLERLLSGTVGPAVGIEGDMDNIQAAITILQPHVPPDFANSIAHYVNAMREELGFSQNQEGSFSPYHGKTASESMIVAESFEQRVDERRDIVADVIVRIVRKWNQMIFKFWSEERVIQVVGPEGMPDWITFTGDQLKGHYLLSVDAESGIPISRAMRTEMSVNLLKMFGGDQLIDQLLLRTIVLDNFAMVDPRVNMLMQNVYGGPPQELSAGRQPSPAIPGSGGAAPVSGGGRGSGGGRTPTSPSKPLPFDQFKKNVENR